MTYQLAWVSDDSFITLRYVNNVLDGYGPVYNINERVLGYTHPLWFLCVLTGSLIFGNPALVAIGLGLALTCATMLSFAWLLYSSAKYSWVSVAVLGLASILLVSSDSWLSFQTSGLENSLTHIILLFIVNECVLQKIKRPSLLAFLLTLLCLNRPDCIFLALPIGLLVLKNGKLKDIPLICLAIAPGIMWLIFSWSYYGHPLPNTGEAKLAVYPSHWHAITQGLLYLQDWFNYETLACVGTIAFLLLALGLDRSAGVLAIAIGIVLQALWVIWIGGDFMRGRFLIILLTSSIFLGAFVLSRLQRKSLILPALAGLAVTFLVLVVLGPIRVAADKNVSAEANPGIVNERLFYSGNTLDQYLRFGSFNLGTVSNDVGILRNYVSKCGPLTLHLRNPGTIGYFTGNQVTIIDALGLTDRFIAQLPRKNLINQFPRPGHPDKFIPIEYLSSRGDIRIVPDWFRKLKSSDCTLNKLRFNSAKDDVFMGLNNQMIRLPLEKKPSTLEL